MLWDCTQSDSMGPPSRAWDGGVAYHIRVVAGRGCEFASKVPRIEGITHGTECDLQRHYQCTSARSVALGFHGVVKSRGMPGRKPPGRISRRRPPRPDAEDFPGDV
jgi:hypothetical protein